MEKVKVMAGNLVININDHLKLWSNNVETNIYPLALALWASENPQERKNNASVIQKCH